jgi:6-phosphofructokinase 1
LHRSPQRITEKQNRVSITDRMWARLLSSTNQPSFLCNKVVEEAKKEEERTAQLIDGSPSHRKVGNKVAGSNSSSTK